jgi:nitric oxide reductase NorD protein
MAADEPLSADAILASLEQWLEVEFTFLQVGDLATAIAALPRDEQEFLLGWTRRIASNNIPIAYQFAGRAQALLARMDRQLIEAWALHAMDTYDKAGLREAMEVLQNAERFVHQRHERAAGVVLEQVSGILLTFLRGLSGRELKLEQGEAPYTDSGTLFLPAVVAQMPEREQNFTLCKAMTALLWAQTRFGTFRADLRCLDAYADPQRALRAFHALETLRLEACIGRELPGLHREMQRLKTAAGDSLAPEWQAFAVALSRPPATVEDCLALLPRAYAAPPTAPFCYQGELRPAAVADAMAARQAREKMLLRARLAELAQEHAPPGETTPPPRFEVREGEERGGLPQLELVLDGKPLPPPADVARLLTSIRLDLDGIPPEYLVPAGPGEYDPKDYREQARDPDEVWQGTYHEEGAVLYPEWDYGRQHYRKNWCVMREKDVQPVRDGFVADALARHSGLVKHLRRTFEALRDEDRLLKRQFQGDEVDIDALVEALADTRDGREMSERLFLHMHRAERDIAVMFLVDMSGSTRGWINDAQRESLLLLCGALETLGDRYAIHGFSGITRKRCELYRIKRLDEPYGEEVQARISGIRPQDYTRMGFAIRHLTALLKETDAATRLLITLSDGKPDDYHDQYRGQYGIEDTRQALVEARRAGIHPFCITLDTEARAYLPHMYGPARYTIVSEVRQLPLKVADVYRRLTC